MKFIREISIKNLSSLQINDLEQAGFTLVIKEDSIELYYQESITV